MAEILTRESENFGWDYALIGCEEPTAPNFTGTVKDVLELSNTIVSDLIGSHRGRWFNVWFLDGKQIKSVNGKGLWNFPVVDFHALAYEQGRDSLDIETY